jgi:hypothetical protein
MTAKAIRNLIFLIILILFIAWASLILFTDATLMPIPNRHSKDEICQSQLSSLHLALLVYSNEKNKYPPKENWCNLLIKDADTGTKVFKCPNDKQGPSSYALNPNAEPNSPENVVVIFESKSGWNQFGGKELLDTGNHKGHGANVLLTNGAVLFIKKEDFGKLNWGTPQEPNKIQNAKEKL